MQIRAASIDITPDLPCGLAGNRFRLEPYSRINDPLEMNAVLMTDTGGSLLLVSVDSLYAGPDLKAHIRTEASRQLGIPSSCVLVCASHTHFAPSLDRGKPQLGTVSEEYLGQVLSRASQLIGALAAQAPCDISIKHATTPTDRAVNRRYYWPYPVLTRSGPRWGSIVLAPATEKYCENEVNSLWLRDGNGDLIALIWSYACHPVSFPAIDNVSSEYPGLVRDAVRKDAGKNIPVLFLQGFCGDIRPFIPARKSLRTSLKTLLMGPRFGRFNHDEWKQWAEGVAGAVLGGNTNARDVSRTCLDTTTCSLNIGDIFTGTARPDRIEFSGVSMGPTLRMLFVSAEPVAELREFVDPDVILVGYEGDVFGYLPTDVINAEGGYEGKDFISSFSLSGHFNKKIDKTFARMANECCFPVINPHKEADFV